MSNATLRHQLLDLLVDGPSSFAALYSAANRLYPSIRPSLEKRHAVGELWDALVTMVEAGWVKARQMLPEGGWAEMTDLRDGQARRQYQEWLPDARYEEMSVDEVGVWFEIQPRGRAEWAKWAEAVDGTGKWILDQDPGTATITVRAEDMETAEQVLSGWLSHRPDLEVVPGSRTVQSSAGFCLRDGTFIEGGMSLRVTYRLTRGQSGRPSR